MGRALEDLGDADGALGCYRNALARRPSHAPTLAHYFALLREEAPPGLLAAADATIASPETPDEARALIAYGLAKYHDRRKRLLAGRGGRDDRERGAPSRRGAAGPRGARGTRRRLDRNVRR